MNGYQEHFPGKALNISYVLDSNTRSAKVRIDLPNPKGPLREAMFVTATFHASQSVERVVVSASAVVRPHDREWISVPAAGNQLRVAVQLGPHEEDGSRFTARRRNKAA